MSEHFDEIGWMREEYETLHSKYAAAVIRRNELEFLIEVKRREARIWKIVATVLFCLGAFSVGLLSQGAGL